MLTASGWIFVYLILSTLYATLGGGPDARSHLVDGTPRLRSDPMRSEELGHKMSENEVTRVSHGSVCVPERWRLRPARVPKSRYVDEAFLKLELERLFPGAWLMACRSEEVEDAGAFVEFTVAGESLAVVRTSAGELKALSNSCRHRGTRLLLDRGRFPAIRCPFHAWCWDFDGSFKYRPDADHFDEQDPKSLALPEYPLDEWGGFVFVSFDQNAPPLLEFLAPLPERLAGFRLEDMRYKWHKTFQLQANWKTAVDAFIEAYHVPGTHPQYLRGDFAPTSPGSVPEMELWPRTPRAGHPVNGLQRTGPVQLHADRRCQCRRRSEQFSLHPQGHVQIEPKGATRIVRVQASDVDLHDLFTAVLADLEQRNDGLTGEID